MKNNKYRIRVKRGTLIDGYRVTDHPLYKVYANMLDRCHNPNSTAFHNYGARGIKVCPDWRSFEKFVSDMGPRPTPHHSLERKNNDLGYEAANCVWATHTTQAINRRRFTNNTSGATGVKVTESGMWHIVFDFKGTRFDLGRYGSFDDACLARAAWIEGFLTAQGGLHGLA